MDERQEQINQNVQQRLRSLEAASLIDMAVISALIATHPRPMALREAIEQSAQRLIANSLNTGVSDDFVHAQDARLQLFLKALQIGS